MLTFGIFSKVNSFDVLYELKEICGLIAFPGFVTWLSLEIPLTRFTVICEFFQTNLYQMCARWADQIEMAEKIAFVLAIGIWATIGLTFRHFLSILVTCLYSKGFPYQRSRTSTFGTDYKTSDPFMYRI